MNQNSLPFKSYRVLISGDRNWTGSELEEKIWSIFVSFPSNTEIVHGACKGVDMTADKIGREFGFPIKVFHADWNKYGKSAGTIRDSQMLDYGIDVVYAFHQHIETSRGTKNTIIQANKRNIPVALIK